MNRWKKISIATSFLSGANLAAGNIPVWAVGTALSCALYAIGNREERQEREAMRIAMSHALKYVPFK